MQILLISPENTLVAFGLRYIAAQLKEKGYRPHILFLPRNHWQSEKQSDIDIIVNYVKIFNPDLIAFSLMTNHFWRVAKLTSIIKEKLNCPVVWGGIHPTVAPEECIQHADAIAIGEGDLSFCEFVERFEAGQDYSHIDGFWVNAENGAVIKNSSPPRVEDLDQFAFPDYELETQHIFQNGAIIPLTQEIIASYYPGVYGIHYYLSTRGCPLNCAFCCNSALRNVAEGRYLRRRSPENVIDEITAINQQFSHVESVCFMDDSFLSASDSWFEEFIPLYNDKVNMPFFCQGVPGSIREKNIEKLVPIGLIGVHIGLQTGSERINFEVYNRKISNEKFLSATKKIDKFYDSIKDRRYDVITDNPFETEEDTAETIKVMLQVKKPYYMSVTSLMFFPGTTLYTRAKEKQLSDKHLHGAYQKEFWGFRKTFINRLLRYMTFTPNFVTRFFLKHRHQKWARGMYHIYYYSIIIFYRKLYRPLRNRIMKRWLEQAEGMSPARKVLLRVSMDNF